MTELRYFTYVFPFFSESAKRYKRIDSFRIHMQIWCHAMFAERACSKTQKRYTASKLIGKFDALSVCIFRDDVTWS